MESELNSPQPSSAPASKRKRAGRKASAPTSAAASVDPPAGGVPPDQIEEAWSDRESPAEATAPKDEESPADPDGMAGDLDAVSSSEPAGPAPEVTTEQVIEAILFGADTPLTPAKLVSILGTGSARDIRRHIEELNARYAQIGTSFRIEKIAGGYQMLTLPAFNAWLKRLKQTRQESKLSQAALETLAVVAYKQPVVRAEIEAIRGVATGEMLNRLREVGLVKIVGRAEDVGRPLLYGTTKRFLDVFGLGSLEDLPTVEELKAPE